MELSLLLMQQICQLFIMIFFGFLLVRCRILKSDDSMVLSKVLLYVISPCAIVNSFAIELTSDKLVGLGLSFLGAIVVHLVFIPLATVLSRFFGFTSIEKATMIYPNAGNLIIPLVGAILGNEWILYTSGYMVVQTILLWTHAKNLVSNERKIDIKKIIFNVNILAIVAGLFMFLMQIRLPSIMTSALGSVGGMIGPVAMMVIGMLIGDTNLKDVFGDHRLYLISLMRLIVFPITIIIVFYITGLRYMTSDASQIFLITLFAASAPPAAMITQFAQLYNKHPQYASLMNVMGVIFSILTMPLMVMIYQML